jgi:hypothetical protein
VNVNIEVISQTKQRYCTAGDWWLDEDGNLQIRVSRTRPHFEALVAHHELTEAMLCIFAGITTKQVDDFDIQYECARSSIEEDDVEPTRADCGCVVLGWTEPGDDIHAPYYKQHQIATGFERTMAAEMGVSWHDYEAEVLSTTDGTP